MNAKLYHSRRHELLGYPEAAGKGGQPSPESCMPEDSPGGFEHVVGNGLEHIIYMSSTISGLFSFRGKLQTKSPGRSYTEKSGVFGVPQDQTRTLQTTLECCEA